MRTIDGHKIADEARFNGFHWLVLLWCGLIIVFDGYDLAVVGIALPSIMKDLNVAPTQAGFMVSAALFGMMFGAITLGTVADRIGRRKAIAICIALFSVFTAAAGMAKDPLTFSAMRFLAGLGIGGVMPNVIAHMTEYAPKRIRAMMVTLMFSGYSVGSMLAAVVGKGLIESHGWQSVFLAAALPVVLIPLILKTLPESMPYLLKAGRYGELQRTLSRLDPGLQWRPGDQISFSVGRSQSDVASIGGLFGNGRGFSTLMFWISFFMCLFMVYALNSWLTKLMVSAGYSLGSALTFTLVLNFGAIIGAVGGGWLADRFHIKGVLVVMFAIAAVSISLLGQPMSTGWLYLLVGLADASTIGTQIVNSAYAGQFYPAFLRGTGIGWALGVGRGGAILAPILIGYLVSLALPLQQNFIAIAIPAGIAAVAIAFVNHRRSDAEQSRAQSSAASGVSLAAVPLKRA